ncbi:hypothetical protein [Cytobacillus pseudoceanisediminis]
MAIEVSREQTNEDLIHEIIEKKEAIKTEEEWQFFNDYIKGKSTDEISNMLTEKIKLEEVVDLLLAEETSDDGGIIALSGFYFQFLVTIEYLIDLINEEWDYLLIDHHQDIITVREDKIRVIQVKTKNVEYCDVSETKLYTEWIQKLFIMDEMLKDYPQKTEFELVTNFIVKNSKTVQVEIYHNNDEYDMKIQKNSFFSKVQTYSEQGGFTSLSSEEYLEELLAKFKITKKDSEDYIYKIASDIGSLFNERFKGTKEDIDFLVGYICSTCYYPSNPSVQLIDKSKALRIFEELRGRFDSGVRQHVEIEDSISKIDYYILNLHTTLSKAPSYDDLSKFIAEFECELKSSIYGSNNIYSILSRFIERVYSSPRINVSSRLTIDNSVKELLDLAFYIKLATGGKVTIDDKHSKLLLKVIGSQKYSFFNLDDIDDYEKGIAKFTEVFKMCDIHEKIMLFSDKILKLVFAGDYDDFEFPNEHFIEIGYEDIPTDEDMRTISLEIEKDSIAKVTYKVRVMNGSNNLKRDLLRNRILPTIENYQEYVKKQLG